MQPPVSSDPDGGEAEPEDGPTQAGNPGPQVAVLPDHPILELVHKPRTLDEAVAAIRAAGAVDPKLMKRLASDARVAAKLVYRSMPAESTRPRALPCAPESLRPYLLKVMPARFRMTTKRWSSIKSSVTMVLKITGWHVTTAAMRVPLTPAWQAAADQITPEPKRALITAFGRFCDRKGINPADVTENTLGLFKAWRTEHTLDLTPSKNIANLRCAWNRAQRVLPDWPGRQLAPPPNPKRYRLAPDQLDPEFITDLNAYITKLETPSPFHQVFNRKKAPLTLIDIRGSLMRAASVLIGQKVSVTRIRDVVCPASYKAVLLEAYERMGDGTKWPTRATSIAGYLYAAARDWAGLSAEELAEVTRLRKMVKAPPAQMTEKSRDRLAQFDDPKMLKAFFELPHEMFDAADLMLKAGKKKHAAQLHQTALALAILQAKPLRRENLVELEHDRHFLARGKHTYGELRIRGTQTKNGAQLQAALPDWLAQRLDRHVQIYRPLIEVTPGPYLFPSQKGNHTAAQSLASKITRLVERHVGAEFNVHAIRHLAATLLLEESGGNLPVAQTLIGHRDPKTTARFYAQQRTRAAQVQWMGVLEKHVTTKRRASFKRSILRPISPENPSWGGAP